MQIGDLLTTVGRHEVITNDDDGNVVDDDDDYENHYHLGR